MIALLVAFSFLLAFYDLTFFFSICVFVQITVIFWMPAGEPCLLFLPHIQSRTNTVQFALS